MSNINNNGYTLANIPFDIEILLDEDFWGHNDEVEKIMRQHLPQLEGLKVIFKDGAICARRGYWISLHFGKRKNSNSYYIVYLFGCNLLTWQYIDDARSLSEFDGSF